MGWRMCLRLDEIGSDFNLQVRGQVIQVAVERLNRVDFSSCVHLLGPSLNQLICLGNKLVPMRSSQAILEKQHPK